MMVVVVVEAVSVVPVVIITTCGSGSYGVRGCSNEEVMVLGCW